MINVCFLTEGGGNKGFGHITRCNALYEAFEELGCRASVIIESKELILDGFIKKNVLINEWSKNLMHHEIKDAKIIIIDSYSASSNVYGYLSQTHPIAVFLDDNIRVNYPEGILLNGAMLAEEMDYPKNSEIAYLLGKDFTPLRKCFWDAPVKEIKSNITSILITTGGNDIRNLTPALLELIKLNFPSLQIKVFATDSFTNLDHIKTSVNQNIEILMNPDPREIKLTMQNVDLAVSTSGQTLYELARMGVPTIAIQVVDNQKDNVYGWSKVGFIDFAGLWDDPKLCENILANFKTLSVKFYREKKSELGQNLIDGQGARRVADFCFKSLDKK